MNKYQAEISKTGAPSAIHGRRRPQRVGNRSDSQPIAGSETTSNSLATNSMAPTMAVPSAGISA